MRKGGRIWSGNVRLPFVMLLSVGMLAGALFVSGT